MFLLGVRGARYLTPATKTYNTTTLTLTFAKVVTVFWDRIRSRWQGARRRRVRVAHKVSRNAASENGGDSKTYLE
jgi:hypothetical protein